MAKQIGLVVSDIDGTLITSNHEIAPSTKAAAARLFDLGITLTLASSRPPRSIKPLADELGLRGGFASFNGALVTTMTGDVLLSSALSVSTAEAVKAIADDLGIGMWLYDESDWYCEVRDAFVEREEHTSGFSPEMKRYAERLKAPLTKVTVVGKPELVAIAEQRVLGELAGRVSASRSKPRFLDVTAHGMHKGTVVLRLAELFGIAVESVAVIGDGPNDVEMFRQAGLSIAMGQAVDEVKACADYVTDSNDDEGWARGIEAHVLAGRGKS